MTVRLLSTTGDMVPTGDYLIPLGELSQLIIYENYEPSTIGIGDIATSGVQFISGIEEVAQTVVTRLRLFLGEYFRDITDGTPWFEQVLGKGSSLEGKEAAIKNRIVRTDGVIQLVSFSTDFDINTRTYSVKAGILTQFGTTQISVTDVI